MRFQRPNRRSGKEEVREEFKKCSDQKMLMFCPWRVPVRACGLAAPKSHIPGHSCQQGTWLILSPSKSHSSSYSRAFSWTQYEPEFLLAGEFLKCGSSALSRWGESKRAEMIRTADQQDRAQGRRIRPAQHPSEVARTALPSSTLCDDENRLYLYYPTW